jgi:hypothetical protein
VAEELLTKTFTYLKVSDEQAFLGQWLYDLPLRSDEVPYMREDAREDFRELRSFLDTVLQRGTPFHGTTVEKLGKLEAKSLKAKYRISAYFEVTEKYAKGVSFYVDYVEEKWLYRSAPELHTRSSE